MPETRQLEQYMGGRLIGTVVRTATVVVAASNALSESRRQADFACDGVADEAEINAAIAALPASGGRVVLSEGTFNIAEAVSLNGDYISLVGQGPYSTVLNAVASGTIIDIPSKGVGSCYREGYIGHLGIKGNKGSYTTIGIDLTEVWNFRLEYLYVYDCTKGIYSAASYVTGMDGLTVQESYVRDCVEQFSFNSGGQIHLVDCYAIIELGAAHNYQLVNVAGARLLGCISDTGDYGFHIADSDDVALGFCRAYSGNRGFNFEGGDDMGILRLWGCSARDIVNQGFLYVPGAGKSIEGVVQQGCDAKGCGTGLYLGGTGTLQDVDVSHNDFSGATTPVDDSHGGTKTNVRIEHNHGHATENSGTATLVNGQTSIVVNHGLAVTPAAGDIMVTPIEAWGAMTEFYIDTYTSTQFTIHADQDPGQDVDFAWKAVVL